MTLHLGSLFTLSLLPLDPMSATCSRLALSRAALLLIGLLALGCARQDRSPADTLVVAIGSNPTNLDPRFSSDAYSDKISNLIFDALVRREVDGKTTLSLASSQGNPDDTTWVFTLRDGVSFHDGSPLTSADVVATFESIRAPATASVKKVIFDRVETIQAPDPKTVVFRLKEPYAPFLENLTIGILPAAEAARPPSEARLIGSGPYRFVEYKKDQSVTLAAHPGHWRSPPRLGTLLFKIIPEATVRALELIHGSVDLTQNDMPPYLVEALAERPGLTVTAAESILVKYLAFNLSDPQLGDVRVRQAIALGINVEEIITYRFRGLASRAHSFLHPSNWYWSASVAGWPHDPARARRLLDEAGLADPDGEGPRPRLTLVYRTSMDETAVATARLLAAQLKEIGIEVTVRTNEWGVFFGDIKQGRFQLYSLTAVGVFEPDYYHFLFHSSNVPPAGPNRALYRNPTMDALIEEGRRTLAPERRKEIYARVQQIAGEEIPYLPMWYDKNVVIHQRNVRGFQLTPNGDFVSLPSVWKED